MSHWMFPLAVLGFVLLVGSALLRANRSPHQKREIYRTICRHLFLKCLTFLGVMALWCLFCNDIAWIWWAVGFQLLAVVASLDWKRPEYAPAGMSVDQTSHESFGGRS